GRAVAAEAADLLHAGGTVATAGAGPCERTACAAGRRRKRRLTRRLAFGFAGAAPVASVWSGQRPESAAPNGIMSIAPDSGSTMLETIERETGPSPRHSVIWLHGLGADGSDFVPILPELVRPEWPSIRFVFPHAPVRPVTINNGVPIRAWYDIREADLAN